MLTPILISFAIMALGWLARARGILGPGSEKPFNDYLYYFAMPALILDKMTASGISGAGPALLAANAVPVLAAMLLILAAWKLSAVKPKLAGELMITAAFGNTVYLGFPVVALRLGSDAVALAAVVTSVHYLIVFTAGIAAACWISGRNEKGLIRRTLWTNSIIWSSLIGAALAAAGLHLPWPLEGAVSLVGSSTAPLALFAVGAFLYGKSLGQDRSSLAALCAAKLLVFPALTLVCLRGFGVNGLPGQVSLLESLMPLAVTNFVIAQKLGWDEGLIVEAILASTLLAIPTLAAFDLLVRLI
ncbi:MAG: AEC family transporter [Elusimicrobiota bacterium]|jgi:predicted permease